MPNVTIVLQSKCLPIYSLLSLTLLLWTPSLKLFFITLTDLYSLFPSHNPVHTHTHTLTQPCTHTPSHNPIHTHTFTQPCTHTHTQTHSFALTLPCTHTYLHVRYLIQRIKKLSATDAINYSNDNNNTINNNYKINNNNNNINNALLVQLKETIHACKYQNDKTDGRGIKYHLQPFN